jgi:hypothetical protein
VSIKEKKEEIKPSEVEDAFLEEEFDLVPSGAKNKVLSRKDTFLNLGLILLAVLVAYGLGRLHYYEETASVPVKIIQPVPQGAGTIPEVKGVSIDAGSQGVVVASKSGTKYHYPWCSGAKQISAKNKIVFASPEEAQKAGYSPATNCKGLK